MGRLADVGVLPDPLGTDVGVLNVGCCVVTGVVGTFTLPPFDGVRIAVSDGITIVGRLGSDLTD